MLVVTVVAGDERQGDERQVVDYLTTVKPLLKERCYACHGGLKQEGGLRVDTAAAIRVGGDSGEAIIAGDAENSLLLSRVAASDVSERMPPEHEGEPFDEEQLEQLRSWIDAGAAAPADEQPELSPDQHWAFQPLVRPAIPSVPLYSGWIANPIDAFVAEQYVARELEPVAAATPLAQVRRLYIDLTGLPPTPAALESALERVATQPDWHRRLAAELLDSPQYGERWGRHWMDIWRYSDWWGLGAQLRNSQQHMWHWRDWIIESLNKDVPYDEMIRQMLAADELYPADLDRLRGTGYLARNYFLFNRNQWMDETVEHVSKAFLGLTMNCAKCHDHKYDPLSHEDYYRLRAVFEPYHVRMDMLPGEVDLTLNGVPRAFDGWLDVPTYRFIRGEEQRPDTSRVLKPAVPEFFEFASLEIEAVELPAAAWQPQRQPWVTDNYIAKAKRELEQARSQLAEVEGQLRELAEAPASEGSAAEADTSVESDAVVQDESVDAGVRDRFETLDRQRWTTRGGEWSISEDGLEQSRDEPQTAYLDLNQPSTVGDFEADLHFTIRGGTPYRSIGIAFDRQAGERADERSHEFQVYVSAHAAGPKLQIAYRREGEDWHYPNDALQSLKIGLGEPLHLNLKVRGRLVNASVNGGAVLAWTLPIERRQAGLALTSYTAQVVYREFAVRSLSESTRLIDPAAEQLAAERRKLPAEVDVAQAAVRVAEAEVAFCEDCARLLTCEAAEVEQPSTEQQRWQTIRSQRQRGLAKGELALAKLRLEEIVASGDKSDIEKRIEKAEREVTELRERYAAMGEVERPLESLELEEIEFPLGAKWSTTRFKLSTTDDPDVPFPPTSTGRRSALAAWIIDRRNPLTARVAVNHLWARHFGSSLLSAEFDVGRNQPQPVQHKLLDWLAAELIDSGWSMKHVHRLIVASSTYRLSTSTEGAEQQLARDPDNQFLWRRVPIRLESQVVRDAVLMQAGELELQLGGPSVAAAEQANSRRRSLYFFHSNNERNLLLTTFDEARVQECYRREQSIVPQQALALSNSQLVLGSMEKIAARIAVGDGSDRDFVHNAFRQLLGCEPGEAELSACVNALTEWQLAGEKRDAARAGLVWTLVNHHDFVTLR